MSMKPQGDTAEVIQFPTHKIRKPASAPKASAIASAAPNDATARTNTLLAAAETCWYHGEAVSELRSKH